METTELKRVIVTQIFSGIFSMQVCAVPDATDEEILAVANSENPSGTTNGWCEVVRENDEDERLRPIACNYYPKRKHFIIHC